MSTLDERIKLLIAEKKRAVAEEEYDTAKQLSKRIRKLKLKAGARRQQTEESSASSSAPTPRRGESRTSTSSNSDGVKNGKKKRRVKPKLIHMNPQSTCDVIASDDDDEEGLDPFSTDQSNLSLANRKLRMVPLQLAKKNGSSCKRLDLTGNEIRTADNIDCFTHLETLILDRCGLSSVSMLPPIPSLRTLWLNHNNISELTKLVRELKERFPKLTYLSLLKNPVCPDLYFTRNGNLAQYKKYRRTILHSLKRLECLDAKQLTKDDRDDARRNGKFLAVAKPKMSENKWSIGDDDDFHKDSVADLPDMSDHKPAAFIGRGRIKYDGRDSEGNRFIRNNEL